MDKAFIDAEGKLVLSDARIIFKNFAGEKSDFNAAGNRNFCVIIDDPALATQLRNDGWNVKIRANKDNPDETSNYIKVNVSYGYRAPRIVRHIGDASIACDEDTVKELDTDWIMSADLVINPYHYNARGREGISGYLESMDAVIKTSNDYFGGKYGRN